jgi:hypothetical protein
VSTWPLVSCTSPGHALCGDVAAASAEYWERCSIAIDRPFPTPELMKHLALPPPLPFLRPCMSCFPQGTQHSAAATRRGVGVMVRACRSSGCWLSASGGWGWL